MVILNYQKNLLIPIFFQNLTGIQLLLLEDVNFSYSKSTLHLEI